MGMIYLPKYDFVKFKPVEGTGEHVTFMGVNLTTIPLHTHDDGAVRD